MSTHRSEMRRRELGRRLRQVQEKSGLNGIQLAEELGWTTTAVSRTLTGHRSVGPLDLAAFLAVCRVTGHERERLLQLAEPATDGGVFHVPPVERWETFLAHARDTVRLVDFQPVILPWTVQLLDYTRALCTDPAASGVDVAAEVAARHEAVRLMSLPTVELFVHEWALRNPVGDPELMSEQLHHLLRISVRPSVSIRVVPMGQVPQIARYGGFSLLEFADEAPAVYRESPTYGTFLDDPEGIAEHRSMAHRLDRVAASVSRSRELIGQLAVELYGHDKDSDSGPTAHA